MSVLAIEPKEFYLFHHLPIFVLRSTTVLKELCRKEKSSGIRQVDPAADLPHILSNLILDVGIYSGR